MRVHFARHKVEFGFYHNRKRKEGLFGAVECKCVGVEETTAGKGKSYLRKIRNGELFTLKFNGRWMDNSIVQSVSLVSHNKDTATIRLTNSVDSESQCILMAVGDNIKIVIDENQKLLNTTPRGDMLREIPGIIRICKTIKLDNISTDVCQFSLYNCLAGPQTIEKAKQVSLVAMDLRKKIDGHWGKEEINENNKNINFIHVICEFSHWEEKSRNVITTCIDHNIIVPDAVLIKAFEVFESKFGIRKMLDMISKNNYETCYDVREAISEVFEHFEGHIFYDIALKAYVKFDYQDSKLVVTKM